MDNSGLGKEIEQEILFVHKYLLQIYLQFTFNLTRTIYFPKKGNTKEINQEIPFAHKYLLQIYL